MHHPDRWPIVLGPADSTKHVAKLNLYELLNGLERQWIQFDYRFRDFNARMRNLVHPVSRPAELVTTDEVDELDEAGKATTAVKGDAEMISTGKSIENAFMKNQLTKNTPMGIKRLLERAFAEGRPKSPTSENANIDLLTVNLTQSAPQTAARKCDSAAIENSAEETRGSHVATNITGMDNYIYIIEPMEIEEPAEQPEEAELKSPRNNPKKPVQKLKAKTLKVWKRHFKKVRPTKRRNSMARKQMAVRVKSCETQHPSVERKEPDEIPAKSDLVTEALVINQVPVPRLPKKRFTEQYSAEMYASIQEQSNQSGPSISQLVNKQSSHADQAKQPKAGPMLTSNASANKQSNGQLVHVSSLPEKKSGGSSSGNTLGSGIDEKYSLDTTLEVEPPFNPSLEVKREIHEAIAGSSSSNGIGGLFSTGDIAENAKIVYKALMEHKKSKSADRTPSVFANTDHNDDDGFGDILYTCDDENEC